MSDPDINGESVPAESGPDRPGAAGAALLKERRRQGLSLGDVSRQLKLSVRQVEALERDDYSAYKGPVFIHGFIRNYAKVLGLAPEPLIRAADAMLNPLPTEDLTAREPEQVQSVGAEKKTRSLWPAAVAVIVVGLAMSIYISGRRAPDAARNAPKVATRDTPAPAKKAPAESKTSVEAKSKADPKSEESATKPAAKPDKKPEAKTDANAELIGRRARVEADGVQAEQGAEPGTRVTVRMIFEQESWVEIKDRSGNTIFGQLNPAGSRRSVSGDPPLSVVVGHAVGVHLFQGDKNIDLAPHTRVDVARLTLE